MPDTSAFFPHSLIPSSSYAFPILLSLPSPSPLLLSRQAKKTSLTKREGSKLVIYGLSGLASSQDDGEEDNGMSEHGSSGLLEVSDTVTSPDDRAQSSLQGSIDNTLPVIEEEYGSNHDSLIKREGFGSNHDSSMGNHTPSKKREGFGDHSPPKMKEGFGGSDRTPPNKRFGDRTPPVRRDGIGGDRTPPTRRDGFDGDRTAPTRKEGYISPTKREGHPNSPVRRSSVGSPNRKGDHHSSPTRRGEGLMVHQVPLADRENSRQSSRQARWLGSGSGGIAGSMPLLKREPRIDGGAYEGSGYGKQQGDYKHWNSPPLVQGSIGDVEHKSISSVLRQRQQRHGNQPPPHLPPRAFSETEVTMEGRGQYGTEHRADHTNYHYRGPSGNNRNGGGGGHRERLNSSPHHYSSPSSPHYSSQSPPYPPTPSPHPPPQGSPHHRPPYHNYPYGRTSPYYQSHRGSGGGGGGGGGGGNEIKRRSPQYHNRPHSIHEDNLSPPHHHHHHHQHQHQPPPPRYSPLHTSGHSTRPSYHPRGDERPHSKPTYWHQHSSGRSSSQGGEDLALSYESYHNDIMGSGGGNSAEYSNGGTGLKKSRGIYHSTPGIRAGDTPRYLHSYRRRSSQGDAGPSENWWQGDQAYSPAASSGGGVGGERKHFKYPAYQGGSANRNPQASWKGGQQPPNGTWQEDEEDTVSRTSSSLPLNTNPSYSLYEEDEDRRPVRPRAGSHDQASLHDSRRHVPRHIRLRHSTITSLTSLPDINGVSVGVVGFFKYCNSRTSPIHC